MINKDDAFGVEKSTRYLELCNMLLWGAAIAMFWDSYSGLALILKLLGFFFLVIVVSAIHGVKGTKNIREMLCKDYVTSLALKKKELEESIDTFGRAVGQSAQCGLFVFLLAWKFSGPDVFEPTLLALAVVFLSTSAFILAVPNKAMPKAKEKRNLIFKQMSIMAFVLPLYYFTLRYIF